MWNSCKEAKNTIDNVVRNLGNLNESRQVRSRKETAAHMHQLLDDADKLLKVYSTEELATISGKD